MVVNSQLRKSHGPEEGQEVFAFGEFSGALQARLNQIGITCDLETLKMDIPEDGLSDREFSFLKSLKQVITAINKSKEKYEAGDFRLFSELGANNVDFTLRSMLKAPMGTGTINTFLNKWNLDSGEALGLKLAQIEGILEIKQQLANEAQASLEKARGKESVVSDRDALGTRVAAMAGNAIPEGMKTSRIDTLRNIVAEVFSLKLKKVDKETILKQCREKFDAKYAVELLNSQRLNFLFEDVSPEECAKGIAKLVRGLQLVNLPNIERVLKILGVTPAMYESQLTGVRVDGVVNPES